MSHPQSSTRALTHHVFAALLGAAMVTATMPAAHAQQAAALQADIPAGPLAPALNRYAQHAGLALSFDPALAQGQSTQGLRGAATPEQAFSALLAGTGLQAVRGEGNNSYTLRRQPATGDVSILPAVTVTGRPENAWGPVEGYVARRSATATKTDTALIETPQSISVISQAVMEAQGVNRVDEALRYSAGVRTEPIYDTRRGTFFIRGFNVSNNGQYLDGMKLAYPGGYAGWEVDPYTLERLEVLRGPSSVLYGQNVPGGLVNQVSKRPQDAAAHELSVQGGSFDRAQLAGDFTGPIGAQGKWLYRLTAVGRESGTQTRHVDDDRVLIAPSLTWKPNADTSLTLLAQYQKDRTGNTANFLPAKGTLWSTDNGRIPVDFFSGDPTYDATDRRKLQAGYVLEHRANDMLTLRQNLRYSTLEVDYKSLGANGGWVEPREPLQNLRRISLLSQEGFQLFSLDNQAQINLDHGALKQTLLFGADYQESRFKRLYGLRTAAVTPINAFDPVYGSPFPGARPTASNETNQTRRQFGLYAQDQLKLHEKWVLQLAGRFDWARSSTDETTLSTGAVKSTPTDDGAFSGKAGLVYLSDTGLAPYVSYSQSFEPASGSDFGGSPFKPTRGKQVELGVKYQPAGGNSFVQASVFDLRQTDVLTADILHPGFSVQTGEVRSRGLELEGTWAVTRDLNLMASYTYNDAKVTKAAATAVNLGKRPAYLADHMASVWADYRIGGSGPLANLWFGAGVRYMGSTNDIPDTFKVPAYTLVDAALRYDWNRYRLSLNASNLFNRQYVAACDSVTNCYYGIERAIMAKLSYHW
ncbi:TonB-dependent siderophore receptor [Achromobacter pestifer]|uniref:Ferrichrome outer membrane transporter/phage receptor n=1 Tax=Achromobacter pestifer TaxID=1353889 RepID=A0A6S7A6G2_9BURK|nr:TonB-dependent siderophore receptor [Achromobacter pestifer]CAB3676961.1 Ferrichrome outer membrane transporter/phage receptor [Achromobacter pestifer]